MVLTCVMAEKKPIFYVPQTFFFTPQEKAGHTALHIITQTHIYTII